MKTRERRFSVARWSVAIVALALPWMVACGGSGGSGDENASSGGGGAANGGGAAAGVLTGEVVEAACGECQFGMEGDSCDLAVRIDGVGYFVDGTSIDDHGDAHASDGLCNAVRTARVTGEIVDGRFRAEAFEVVAAGRGE